MKRKLGLFLMAAFFAAPSAGRADQYSALSALGDAKAYYVDVYEKWNDGPVAEYDYAQTLITEQMTRYYNYSGPPIPGLEAAVNGFASAFSASANGANGPLAEAENFLAEADDILYDPNFHNGAYYLYLDEQYPECESACTDVFNNQIAPAFNKTTAAAYYTGYMAYWAEGLKKILDDNKIP